MINWWLIALLSIVGLSWVKTMASDNSGLVAKIIAIALVGGLMYMAGVFTELWGVYK